MKSVFLFALLLLSPFALQAEQPNILFIAIDDLNDWIEPLGGNPNSRTPNLARLARRSMLFTRAYTSAPACNPSRAAVMTGIAPYHSGVYHNNQAWRPAMPTVVTLPQYFMKNGYWAGGAGKIYHGVYPDPPSWNEYWPSKTQNRPPGPNPVMRPMNGIEGTGNFDWGPLDVNVQKMSDALVADWVGARLRKKQEKPFFLACGIFRPHLPWYIPQQYLDRFPLDSVDLPIVFDQDLQDVPEAGRTFVKNRRDHVSVTKHGKWQQAVQAYLASINFADDMLGRVLNALDESGHANNTIVVLWSDHGWHLGEKHHWRKFALWEEATRVVLMVYAPPGTPGLLEGTRPGARSVRPVNLLDIYPTLLELAGLEQNPAVDGSSLVPLLRNPGMPWSPTVTTHGRLNHAVRSENFRYISYADGTEELYDHRVDPMEWTNLAADDNYKEEKQSLAKWLPRDNVSEAPTQPSGQRTNEVAVP